MPSIFTRHTDGKSKNFADIKPSRLLIYSIPIKSFRYRRLPFANSKQQNTDAHPRITLAQDLGRLPSLSSTHWNGLVLISNKTCTHRLIPLHGYLHSGRVHWSGTQQYTILSEAVSLSITKQQYSLLTNKVLLYNFWLRHMDYFHLAIWKFLHNSTIVVGPTKQHSLNQSSAAERNLVTWSHRQLTTRVTAHTHVNLGANYTL